MLTHRICFIAIGALLPASFAATEIHLTQISTTFNSPIGIDYHQPSGSVIASVNYASGGQPYNLERINLDGSHSQFSNVQGLTDELKIATVQPGNPQFAAGTLFSGTGGDGEILKVAPDGSSFEAPWVSLPGNGNGLMRGSLYVDRTGAYNGDLIVATTAGEVWRIDAAKNTTPLGDLNVHLEGLLVVPNDVAKWGPYAGKILVGAEDQGNLHVFGPNGFIETVTGLGVNIEDIDLIPANENFFGVNFGTSRILGAPASDFASIAGDILLTQEFGSGAALFDLKYDSGAGKLVATPLVLGQGSETPAQWEHVTFAPAGIVEIPPVDTGVPDGGATALLLGVGACGLAVARKRIVQ